MQYKYKGNKLSKNKIYVYKVYHPSLFIFKITQI